MQKRENQQPQEQSPEIEGNIAHDSKNLAPEENSNADPESSKEEPVGPEKEVASNGDATEASTSNGSPNNNEEKSADAENKHDHSHDHGHSNTNADEDEQSKEYIDVKKLHEIFIFKEGETEHHHCHCHGHEYDELVSPSVAGARSSNLKRHSSFGGGSQSGAWTKTVPRLSVVSFVVSAPICLEEEEQVQTINPWVSILLTIVLSIHVILEGLTVGSSGAVNDMKTVFIAVVVHKVFAAFSLGSSLVASGYWTMSKAEGGRIMFFVLAGVFISLDVIGIAVGMCLSEAFEDESNLVAGVLQALLGGSFLFVSIVELIPGEFERSETLTCHFSPFCQP